MAFAVITLSYIFIMNAFPFSLTINKKAEIFSMASFIAQSKQEELNSLGYGNIAAGTIEPKTRLSSDPSSYLYNFHRKTEVLYVNDNLNEEAADLGMKKIIITVYYLHPISKKETSYIINTLISEN